MAEKDEGGWGGGPAMVLLDQVMALKLPDLVCVLLDLLECVAGRTQRDTCISMLARNGFHGQVSCRCPRDSRSRPFRRQSQTQRVDCKLQDSSILGAKVRK
jgi:hypothetical protein